MDLVKLNKERKYISDVSAKDDGKKVTVAGWLYDGRDLGKIRFVLLRDRSGEIQVTGIKGIIDATFANGNETVSNNIKYDAVIVGRTAVVKGDIFFKNSLKTEEGADIDGYIKRANNGKSDTEEDIAIEEIVERKEQTIKPKPIHVVQQKKAV